ncbi:MAG: DoxX family protein [Nitriliruptor sp.]|uniref:DoxX family protein n=1 Tax=Nitriliruptor sp. TaxID=2448056 RepID=UPI0034A05BFB
MMTLEADPTAVDAGLLLLRVLVGVGLSLHGFQKLFGWFGGGGLAGTAGWFRSLGFGDGKVAAILAGTSEIAGGLGLAIGFLTPLASAAVIGTMTVAALVNNDDNGFWSVRKGWELNGYLIAVAWALATAGPGSWSLDALLGTHLSGIVPGLLALGAGVGLGWLRWSTRRPPSD